MSPSGRRSGSGEGPSRSEGRGGRATKGPASKRSKAPRPQPKATPAGAPSQGASKVERYVRSKRDELEVPRDTVVRRVEDVRRLALVALAGRASGGALVTLLLAFVVAYVVMGVALIPLRGILSAPLDIFRGSIFLTVASVPVAVILLTGARYAAIRSVPNVASKLEFLEAHAFVWADPFRDERPRLLPGWLEMLLWAPSQILAGAVPFRAIRQTGQADAEAACDVARRMIEKAELDFTDGLPADSAEARGLRLLLLLRLARLVIKDGRLKGKISGLGHAALFEGTVG